jgi:hypothetical protein
VTPAHALFPAYRRAPISRLPPWTAAKAHPAPAEEAIKRRDAGDESLADIGRSYNVSADTISRLTV